MLNKIINRALELGFDDVEIVENSSSEVSISIFKGNIEKNFVGSDKSYVLKGLINGKMAIEYFQKNEEDLSDKEIDNLILKLKENILCLTTNEVSFIYEGSESYPEVEKVESGCDLVKTQDKIKMLKELEKKAYEASEKIELVDTCTYMEEKTAVRMVNSKGLSLSKSNEYCGLVLSAIAGESKDNPNKQSGFNVAIKNKYADLDASKVAQKATKEALDMIGAEPVESKLYKVIIDKDVMTSLLSGFFSIFTGEAVLRKLTSLTDKLGEKIMSEKITIIDDPLNKDAFVKDPFDSEGVATYTKEVVSEGVFKTFLHNLKTANQLNTKTTGNASTSGVRPMNFHIKNGDTSKDDMIASLDEGLLITSLQGLHASLNPISGDFSGQASGFLIEKGKIVRPVTLIVLSGNFLKMMNDVDKVGNDLEIEYTGFGSPTIMFGMMPISGK